MRPRTPWPGSARSAGPRWSRWAWTPSGSPARSTSCTQPTSWTRATSSPLRWPRWPAGRVGGHPSRVTSTGAAVRPSDLDHLAVPGDPQLHPDRVRTAFVLSEVDVDEDRYHRTIHVHDGTGTRRFTHGPGDSSPRWSPDGRWLAFLRKGTEDDAKPQLHVMPADGGEARRRTALPLGVSELVWSPDSTRLVLVAAVWHEDVADLDDEERARRPKRITRLPYRSDTRGWIHDRTPYLHVVEASGTADPVRLDTGRIDVTSPEWTPDGRAVSFIAEPADWPETEPHSQVLQVT